MTAKVIHLHRPRLPIVGNTALHTIPTSSGPLGTLTPPPPPTGDRRTSDEYRRGFIDGNRSGIVVGVVLAIFVGAAVIGGLIRLGVLS